MHVDPIVGVSIIEPYARMLPMPGFEEFTKNSGLTLLKRVEWCARISHRTEDRQEAESWMRFISDVIMKHGDWSVTEHAVVSVDAIVDRGITHEWVRHRLGSYTQESTRFVNYAKKNTQINEYVNPAKFICPPSIRQTIGTPKEATYNRWLKGRQADQEEYLSHIADGIKPQEARTCFPNALASRLVATYNLRMWRLFFIMRTTVQAHPQMREVTIPLLAEFKEKIPLLFDDIVPESTQANNLRLPR